MLDFIRDSLVLYLPLWKKDAATGQTFMSEDAYGHLCTITGASWRIDGRTFNGITNKIVIADAASLQLTGAFTLGCWMLQEIKGLEGLITKAPGVEGQQEWYFVISATGQVLVGWLSSTNPNYLQCFGTLDVSDAAWHHIMVTWNGINTIGSTVIYVDSAVDALSADTKGGTGYTPYDGVANVEIGRYFGSDVYCFDGWIGEVCIYNRALSAQEIQHIYLATKWRYR